MLCGENAKGGGKRCLPAALMTALDYRGCGIFFGSVVPPLSKV
jgi:hypothetical protein